MYKGPKNGRKERQPAPSAAAAAAAVIEEWGVWLTGREEWWGSWEKKWWGTAGNTVGSGGSCVSSSARVVSFRPMRVTLSR
ncbi:hypothetical protein K0M31_000278 [Melipona bicolor]|uniref:Uncharacterized protein n=1 Tax=Melipona bicolor TaxID=60889 RepID=A0AA40KWN6_9HYME|nr:hypothetical protein K0M31_000278 [Melipona bicolor]